LGGGHIVLRVFLKSGSTSHSHAGECQDLVLFGSLNNTEASPWRLAGGGPAAAHFSCLAKKSKQKKATAAPLPPSGVPQKVNAKAEKQKHQSL
jgi:hypothetical protein